MRPSVGQPAPHFQARSDDGRPLNLTALRGGWVVLIFLHSMSTPAAKLLAQQIEAARAEFGNLGAMVIGVSSDPEAQQAYFRDQYQLSFALLPDGDRSVARAYGSLRGWPRLFGGAAPQTFLIDPQGIVAEHWKAPAPHGHAQEILRALKQRL